MNIYRNPWAKTLNVPKPEFYKNDAPVVFEYRSVKVYRLFARGFDYVLAGCCITQRAGFKPDLARGVIDHILSGKQPVDDEVAEHLRTNGFPAMTYSEYANNWREIDARWEAEEAQQA
jgi:hypothetical protein